LLECSTVRGKERFMKSIVLGIFGLVVAGVLGGRAGQTEQLSNEQGTGQITLFFPTGSAELRQGSE
jgi:hypothetical protein